MSQILKAIQKLVDSGEVRISAHGYNEMAKDGIMAMEVMEGLPEAILVEEYPDFHKGPCVLVLQEDSTGYPIHVVWGIPVGKTSPAVLVTAYRPAPNKWGEDFMRRLLQ